MVRDLKDKSFEFWTVGNPKGIVRFAVKDNPCRRHPPQVRDRF